MALAAAVAPRSFMAIMIEPEQDMVAYWENHLSNTILAWKGQPCDPEVELCRKARREVAISAARETMAWRRDAILRGHALMFDRKLSKAQMSTALRFAASPDGKAFLSALLASAQLISPDPVAKEVWSQVAMSSGVRPSTYSERFYDMTKDLPRSPMRLVPPPVAPPPQPRPRM